MKDRAEALGQVIFDALERLVAERLAQRPGGHLVESALGDLELRLPLDTQASPAEPRARAAELVHTIDRRIDDAIHHAAVFRPGHAWCHRCASAGCEHSAPPSSRHVFSGYAPSGAPRWADFAQTCLDLRHPAVDRLYAQPPALVTLVEEADELHRDTLPVFRDGPYELLGQVAVGFYPLPSRAEEGRGVLALTVQAAASRPRGGRARLGLNLLGVTAAAEPLERLWERQGDLPWRAAVREAQAALRELAGAGRRLARHEVERRVAGILRRLARRLERDHRARSRRTRHAEDRHVSGQRPTRMALGDARGAADEALLRDERSGAVVVLGDRGRTHFFTPGGKLVSSVRYSREAIERKIKSATWRQATSAEAESFRAAVATPEPS